MRHVPGLRTLEILEESLEDFFKGILMGIFMHYQQEVFQDSFKGIPRRFLQGLAKEFSQQEDERAAEDVEVQDESD